MINVRHPASFRDPAGYVIKCDNRLIRVIRPEFIEEYRELLATSWLHEQCQSRNVAAFRVLHVDDAIELLGHESADCLCLEHKIISFPSYPSEWPLEMLCAAAKLTLNLCQKALPNGVGLKDATPYNVLFDGAYPVFIDILSFEKRTAGDPVWLAHGQFVRNFLLPVLIDVHYSQPCHTGFLLYRDGIEPEVVYRMLSPFARFTRPFIGNVTIPIFLAAKAEQQRKTMYTKKILSNPEKATFILESLFSRLARTILNSSLRKHPHNSWSTYSETCTYLSDEYSRKIIFIESFLQASRPKRVLDIGCNTGHFSFIAARFGAEVVATDLDSEVVGCLWKRAYAENANILPLVVNLARPTPAQGWRNQERLSFIDRADGYFDAVMMLAVVHHLLVTDQIPLVEIIKQASKLTTEWMVIEYVGPDDSQFKRLLRGREVLYGWFDRNVFEMEVSKRFEILRKEEIASSGRWLYLTRRINAQ